MKRVYTNSLFPRQPVTEYMAEISARGRVTRHFHYWLGASGKPYLHSVFTVDEAPRYADAVILLVRHDGHSRTPLLLAQTGKEPQAVFSSPAFAHALAQGANEVHLHLMGNGVGDLKNAKDDLSYLLEPAAPVCRDLAA